VGVGGQGSAAENVFYHIDAYTALHGNTSVLSPLWTKFVKYHVSYNFYRELLHVFKGALPRWRRDVKHAETMRMKVHRTEGDSTDLAVDCQVRVGYSDATVANRNVRVWHGATENGPRTRDKSHTFAACVYMRVRATVLSREIGGRRETAA
jgi:hypothetical protein